MNIIHRTIVSAAILPGLLILIGSCAKHDQPVSEPRSFSKPEEAVAALVSALERSDIADVERLLGVSAQVLSSGDDIADQAAREKFLSRYRENNQLVAGGPNDLVLQVGQDPWPLPIPLVRRHGQWSFDGPAGAEELILRRIGRNELRTIQVMRGYVEAQQEYAATGHDGIAAGIYAQRVRSAPGKQDGLYWPTAAGEPPSPFGPLVAEAAQEGYSGTNSAVKPYHGYRYRMLFSQGASAPGGQRGYLVHDQLKDGFALLAYPEKYGVSGIMTFMVNQDGIVWQSDLGAQTGERADSMKAFDPDASWLPIPQEG